MTRAQYKAKYGTEPNVPARPKVAAAPVAPISAPQGKSVGGFLGNVVKSGANLVGGIASAIAHPIQTTKTIGAIGVGGIEKLVPGEQKQEQTFNNVTNFFKERYGSLSKTGETLYNDPVGALADVSTLFSGAGLAAKVGGLSKAAQTLNTVSKATEPISQSLKGAGGALRFATEGRTIAPFKKSYDPMTAAIAKERGVDLPASSLSKSNAVRFSETISGKSLFGQSVVDKVQKAGDRLNEIANNTVNSIRGSSDLSAAGRTVAKGFEKFRDDFMKTKGELYDKASLKNSQIPVDTKRTTGILDRIIKQKTDAAKVLGADPTDLKFFQNLKDGLTGSAKTSFGSFKTGEKVYAKELKSALTELNQKIKNFNDPISTGNQAVLKELFATLSDELDDSVKSANPELAAAIEQANEYFKSGLSTLDSTYGNKITEFADQPDKIVPAIMSGQTSVEDVPRIYNTVGPDAKAAIQAAFLEKLFIDSRGGVDGHFRPTGLNQQLSKYGLPKLEAILEKEQLQAVLDLDKLAKALGKGQSIASGSQTAFSLRMMAPIAAAFSGNILGGLKLLLGDYAFSKFIASKTGQKILTEGATLQGAVGKKVQKAGKAGRILTPIERATETQPIQ